MVKKNKKYDENELVHNRIGFGFLVLLIIFLLYIIFTFLTEVLMEFIQILFKGIGFIMILVLISYIIGYIIFKLFPKIEKWAMEED
jgi:hypothetical protein